jgi:biotin-(acetyl-CoA carboxylase) ligase
MLIDQDRFLQISVDAVLSAVRRLTMNRKGLLDEWRALDYLQGRELEFSGPDGVVAATGIGLADDGRYRIRDHAGVEHLILAGDLNPLHLVTSSL